jgi:hypothetical protein
VEDVELMNSPPDVASALAPLFEPLTIRKMRHGQPFMPFDPAALTQLT